MTASIPETEASFTPSQLKDYYDVYKNKAVLHIRLVINRFLKSSPNTDEETKNLKGIDKAYLIGKFNVLSQDPDPFGNTQVLLIAVDKPDKVFHAIVYTGNGYRLDGFMVDDRFKSEDMRRIRIRYKKFLDDKIHSL